MLMSVYWCELHRVIHLFTLVIIKYAAIIKWLTHSSSVLFVWIQWMFKCIIILNSQQYIRSCNSFIWDINGFSTSFFAYYTIFTLYGCLFNAHTSCNIKTREKKRQFQILRFLQWADLWQLPVIYCPRILT